MQQRVAQLLTGALLLVTVLLGLAGTAAGFQVDADPEIESVIVQEGIRDQSTEVQAIVTALFAVSLTTIGLTIAYIVHTSPRRRARIGRRRAHRKAREMPMGLDELVPGAPPATNRSPVPVPSAAPIPNVETSHG